MQTATCWVVLTRGGSNVRKMGVTPAEAVVLRKLHQNEAGREPVTDLSEVTNVERTSKEEIERLRSIYGSAGGKQPVLQELYPGDSPTLPQTFKEVGLDAKVAEPAKAAPEEKGEAKSPVK